MTKYEIGIYVSTDSDTEELLDEAGAYGEYLESLYSEDATVDEAECCVEHQGDRYLVKIPVETEIDQSVLLDSAHGATHLGTVDEDETYVLYLEDL